MTENENTTGGIAEDGESFPDTWRGAWHASPGPRGMMQIIGIFLRGFMMGTADIIPGVSGGTIAFITGIYTSLVEAIAAFNARVVTLLFRGDLKGILRHLHLRFLIPLMLGIMTAFLTLAHLMHYLINHEPVLTWSLFFGLILASILLIEREIRPWDTAAVITVTVGTIAAYIIVGLIPVDTPQAWWFIMLCGAIAVCAMILPGISGSFLILILSKYEYIIGAVKAPFAEGNLTILLLFGCGCVIGIISFSRVLNYFLHHHRAHTMALLLGLMIGALRKVWPWKSVLETAVIGGKERIIREANVMPSEFTAEVAGAIGLAIVGFLLVYLVEWLSNRKEEA